MNERNIITGIGSVPFRMPASALKYAIKEHDVPYCPEMYKIGETLEAIAEKGTLLCAEEFKRSVYGADLAIVPLPGPVVMWQRKICELEQAPLKVYAAAKNFLSCLDVGKAIILLSEPGLGEFDDYPPMMDELSSELPDALVAVHACGVTDLEKLMNTVKCVSYNAHLHFDITQHKEAYADFRERGGIIIWGIEGIKDVKDFRSGDMISWTCGLGTYTPDFAWDVKYMLDRTADELLRK
ncbi:hypothetical protein JXB11_02265 [Candidatus Woesearchaeota archaeon]|nr:hypothetical protein [Candidatus Woesearchaeota archaeon]